MRLKQLLTAVGNIFGIALLCVFLVAIVSAAIDRARLVYATPETQSSFLRAYTPERAFDRFRSEKHSSHQQVGTNAGAGAGFATHEKQFEFAFIMQSRQRNALMASLVKDVSFYLKSAGAQIISGTGNDDNGLRFQYRAGKSRGIVTIEPPEQVDQFEVTGREPLCPDEVPISIRIHIEEKWIKTGA